MPNICSCGQQPKPHDRRCRQCGQPVNQDKAIIVQKNLTTFEPLQEFAEMINAQQQWLRQNQLLSPVQAVFDAINLVSLMTDASTRQVQATLEGYETYVEETIQQAIDSVRLARRQAEANIEMEIKRQEAAIEDQLAERQHQRQLELQQQQHAHERKMVELQAALELTATLLTAVNEVKIIGLEAEAQSDADARQINQLTKQITKLFAALAKIDAGYKAHYQQLKKLGIDDADLENAASLELLEQLSQAFMDRIAKGVVRYGERRRPDA